VQSTNVDAWTDPAGCGSGCTLPLVFASSGYQLDIDDKLEMPLGSLLSKWMDNTIGGCVGNVTITDPACIFNEDRALPTLAQSLHELGANWCDLCHVFATHDPSAAAIAAGSSSAVLPRDEWKACVQGTLAQIVGPPPDPTLTLNGSCTPCLPGQVSVNGTCTTCAFATLADRSQNQCVVCPNTKALDFAGGFVTCGWGIDTGPLQAPGGPDGSCGEFNIIEFTGLDSILSHSYPEVSFTTNGGVALDQAPCEAASVTATLQVPNGTGWRTLTSGTTKGVFVGLGGGCKMQVVLHLPASEIIAGAAHARVVVTTGGTKYTYNVRAEAGPFCTPPPPG